MKVDVSTPDDDLREEAQVEERAADPQVTVEAEVEAAEETPEVLDAEYEPVKSRRKKKADEAVFSIADIEAAQKEAEEANERYLRLQAEWDNYRKRTARERNEERVRASEDLVEKLLPVVDDIERAIDHADKSSPEGEFAQFVEGVRAMHAKFLDVLSRCGVEPINPVGQEFDMNEHQAVAHVEDVTLPESTVREVYQKGYRMGGHVIRPAMVTVSKGGPARTVEETEGTDDQAGE